MLMTLLHFPELLPNTNAFLQIISSENIHQCFIYILIFFFIASTSQVYSSRFASGTSKM